jgi:small subunit ribosomal protein S1
VKPTEAPRAAFGAFKPSKRDLDAQIEADLAQALEGISTGMSSALTADQTNPKAPTLPGQKRKGTVVGVHGKDVFVDTGGRSQGVLPIQQFEGRTPAIGETVEFDVDRYDSANGILLLTMTGAVQHVADWSGLSVGTVVEAKVTGTNKNKTGLTVEVGGIKGFLPASQLDLYRVEQIEAFEGQRLKVEVVEVDPAERNLIVSRRIILERERQEKAEKFWQTVQEGQTVTGIVKSVKPFGAFVDLGGADGLLPIGELSWQRVNNVEEILKVGQSVEVQIARVDHELRKLSLSLRALHGNPWDDFAEDHRPGSRVRGKVTRIMDFGAFVELTPGIEGLIHVSELSTSRVRRVQDVVKEGQEVLVEILTLDPQQRRIGLSLKTIAAEAEDEAEAKSEAERQADRKEAEERMANRKPSNPNLRGGIGAGPLRFGEG